MVQNYISGLPKAVSRNSFLMQGLTYRIGESFFGTIEMGLRKNVPTP